MPSWSRSRLLKSVRNLLGNYQLKSGLYHYYRGEAKQAIEFLTRVVQAPETPETDRRMAIYYLAQTHISAAEKSEEQSNLEAAVQGYRDALAFTLLIMILLVRPTGLLGETIGEEKL